MNSERLALKLKPIEGQAAPDFSLLPETFLVSVMDRMKTPLWVFDLDFKRVVWANPPGQMLWRAENPDELYARDLGKDMSASVERRLKQYQEDFIRLDTSFSESWTIYPQDEPVNLRVIYSGFRLADGRMAMLCEATKEVADAPETIRSTDALLHTLVMITLTDPEGNPLYRNPAARASVPSSTQSLGERLLRRRDKTRINAALKKSGDAKIVAEARTSTGIRWHEFTVRKCRDAVTGHEALLITEVDVSDLREAERRANYLAYRDPLTRLANRTYVMEEGHRTLTDPFDQGTGSAFMFIDLDRFKNINDSLGHNIGDIVLVEIASRISRVLGKDCVVGRFGGDEFVVLLHAITDRTQIQNVAANLCDVLAKPMFVEGFELRVTPSIGISIYPDHAGTMEGLIKSADIAMYSAKAKGGNGFAWYSPDMAEEVERRLEMEMSLRRAVEFGSMDVYFQPRLNLPDGHIVGAEALLRWKHPTMGWISPAVFIPICEETGLIGALGKMVMQKSVRQQREWSKAGWPIKIAINVSSREFRSETYIEDVLAIIESNGADAANFELEITESLLLSNDDFTQQRLARLKEVGFSIAVDDFGTGYSNLAYMQQYPIDCLKIDRSFISKLCEQTAIAEMIIALCRLLGLRIVAEGVETTDQLDWLKARGVEECQGYLFGAAMPIDQFTQYLEDHHDVTA